MILFIGKPLKAAFNSHLVSGFVIMLTPKIEMKISSTTWEAFISDKEEMMNNMEAPSFFLKCFDLHLILFYSLKTYKLSI